MMQIGFVLLFLLQQWVCRADIITTVAGVGDTFGYNNDGVAATSAYLNYPRGMAIDSGILCTISLSVTPLILYHTSW